MTPLSSLSSLKKFQESLHFDSERDWLMLLIISGIIFVANIVWHVQMFRTIVYADATSTSSFATTQTLSRQSLDALHTLLSSRAMEEAKYVNGIYHFTDPSQ